jgi:hypothetical protein
LRRAVRIAAAIIAVIKGWIIKKAVIPTPKKRRKKK